jgi:hypothetical protein
MVRPWALSAPICVLLICLPLLRPLRHPDPRMISDDEQSRLATVQAIVEKHKLAIENTDFHSSRSRCEIVGADGHWYSDQSPLMSALLSGPYWVMYRSGLTFSRDPVLAEYLLTLLGVTLPMAFAAGLLYRMGRLFELRRPYRAVLALAIVVGSGWISYGTVLNGGAAAAALVVVAAGCLVQATLTKRPAAVLAWTFAAGLLVSLAATYEFTAGVFLVLLLVTVFALRWPLSIRSASVGLYVAGALIPLTVYAGLNRMTTGDLRPGFLHPELRPILATAGRSSDDDDDESPSIWRSVGQTSARFCAALVGNHGLLTHFPILLLGLLGVSMVMHRHWPATTKILAGSTVVGGVAIIAAYTLIQTEWKDAMFANRWFLVFLPLTLFWAGAWLRKPHRPASWVAVSILLCFSTFIAILGATDPQPKQGYDRYTAAGAYNHLVNPPAPPEERTSLVINQ